MEKEVYYMVSQAQLVLPKEDAKDLTMDDIIDSKDILWAIVNKFNTKEEAQEYFSDHCAYIHIDKDYNETESSVYGWTLEECFNSVRDDGEEIINSELLEMSETE